MTDDERHQRVLDSIVETARNSAHIQDLRADNEEFKAEVRADLEELKSVMKEIKAVQQEQTNFFNQYKGGLGMLTLLMSLLWAGLVAFKDEIFKLLKLSH